MIWGRFGCGFYRSDKHVEVPSLAHMMKSTINCKSLQSWWIVTNPSFMIFSRQILTLFIIRYNSCSHSSFTLAPPINILLWPCFPTFFFYWVMSTERQFLISYYTLNPIMDNICSTELLDQPQRPSSLYRLGWSIRLKYPIQRYILTCVRFELGNLMQAICQFHTFLQSFTQKRIYWS